MERDQLADILHRTQDQQEDDMMRLQQHLELQLKQQLQQQYRQVRKVLPSSFLPFVAYFFAVEISEQRYSGVACCSQSLRRQTLRHLCWVIVGRFW